MNLFQARICKKLELDLYAVYPHRQCLTAKMRAFVDVLVRAFDYTQYAFRISMLIYYFLEEEDKQIGIRQQQARLSLIRQPPGPIDARSSSGLQYRLCQKESSSMSIAQCD